MKTIEAEETGRWHVDFKVEKWLNSEDHEAGFDPDEIVWGEKNVLTVAGVTRMLNLLIGAGGQTFDNTHARLGVGSGSTAATSADTDLAGGSKLYHGMDATFPQVATNTLTFKASFADSEANFAWNEWAIDCGGAGTGAVNAVVVAPLLNRRVPAVSLGTKTGGIWVLTVTITIT